MKPTELRGSQLKEKGGSPEDARRGDLNMMTLQDQGALNKAAEDKAALFSAANPGDTRRFEAILNANLMKMKRFTGLFGETVTITPAAAEILLAKHNTRNRPVSRSKVLELTGIITRGEWRVIHQGMSIATDGNLNNGQHRLLAIIEAGRAVDVYVSFGESPEDFNVIDLSRPRSPGDVLAAVRDANGNPVYKHSNQLGTAIKILAYLWGETWLKKSAIPHPRLLEIAEGTHPLLSNCIAVGSRLYPTLGKASPAATGLGLYQIRYVYGDDPSVDSFVKALKEGAGLTRGSSVLVLRDALKDQSLAPIGTQDMVVRLMIVAAIITAWNRRNNKTKIHQLRWSTGTPFPGVE